MGLIDRSTHAEHFMVRNSAKAMPGARTGIAPLLAICLASLAIAPALGAETDSLTKAKATELRLIRALVEQHILTPEKARALLEQAGISPSLLDAPDVPGLPGVATPAAPPSPADAATAPAPGSAAANGPAPGVPIITDSAKRDILEEVHEEVSAQARAEGRADPFTLPAWVRRIAFGGDIRLRYLRDDYASDNSAPALIDSWYQLPSQTTQNTLGAHEFLQLRARLDVTSQINDELKAGIELVTAGGNDATANPVDLDVDLGRYSRPFSAAINLAYLQWQARPELGITGGRMRNPYFKSDLIFAPDLSLDGISATYAPRLGQAWGAFTTLGFHPLQTNQSGPFNAASDQVLYALQGGVDWTGADESRFRLAAAYYNFAGIQGKADPVDPPNNTLNDASAPLFRQFGNTMFDIHYQELSNGATIAPLYGYAAQFRLFNLGAEYEFARFDPVRLALQVDWVRNIGFNAAEIKQRLGAAINALPYVNGPDGRQINGVSDARLDGYFVNVRMGAADLRRWGDWQVFGGVRYLERDAVPDAFTSPDYRLGGTDNQASFVGVNLGLSRATSLTLRYIAARSIDSAPKFGVDTWFLDFNGHF
jgi:hypothetical protein